MCIRRKNRPALRRKVTGGGIGISRPGNFGLPSSPSLVFGLLPPRCSPFTESNLGCLHTRARLRGTRRTFDLPAPSHENRPQFCVSILGYVGIRCAPTSPLYDNVVAVFGAFRFVSHEYTLPWVSCSDTSEPRLRPVREPQQRERSPARRDCRFRCSHRTRSLRHRRSHTAGARPR